MVQTQPTPLGVVPRPLPVMNYNPEKDCDMLRQAMKGAGTNDTALIRVLVSRDEIDMPQIKQYYKQLYGKDLISDIKSDCAGDYEKLLVELAGH